MSDNRFKTDTIDEKLKGTFDILDIFKGSPIDLDEPVELIFEYKKVSVVFMTFNWLHVVERTAFEVNLNNGQIVISKNWNENMYFKKHNCLWTTCVERAQDLPFEPDYEEDWDDEERRKKRAAIDVTSDLVGEALEGSASAGRRTAEQTDNRPADLQSDAHWLREIALAALLPFSIMLMIVLYVQLGSQKERGSRASHSKATVCSTRADSSEPSTKSTF